MPITFVFWNICRNSIQDAIANLCRHHSVDVLMLAESNIDPNDLLVCLNDETTEYYLNESPGCSKIQVFSRFRSEFLPPVYEQDRMTIRKLKLPGLTEILLAITHFPSKIGMSDESQVHESFEVVRRIRETEEDHKNAKTVVVGDLNMNPFESGIAGSNGFHAVMTRDIAKKKTRKVQNTEYPFFYNPMWSLIGDASKGPPGTYYYWKSDHYALFWNMFDQVLIRPELLDRFHNEDLEILETDGRTSLIGKNKTPNKRFSDHLPILFRLSL